MIVAGDCLIGNVSTSHEQIVHVIETFKFDVLVRVGSVLRLWCDRAVGVGGLPNVHAFNDGNRSRG